MGVKEFWKNRSYFQKGFIIGMILGLLKTSCVHLKSYVSLGLSTLLIIGSLIFFASFYGIFFGFIGFLLDLFLEKKHEKRLDWGAFFKPSKKKILFSVLFSFLLIIVCVFLISTTHFYFGLILFESIVISLVSLPRLMLVVIILLSYFFSCYVISRNKKWFIGIIICFLVIMVISTGLYHGITFYNNKFGYSCNTDSDCYYAGCGIGAVNHKYIVLSDPFVLYECMPTGSICENNRCETFIIGDTKSTEDCERMNGDAQSQCYRDFAKKINDSELCDKVEDVFVKVDCKMEFNTLSAEDCEKIKKEKGANDYCYWGLALKLDDSSFCDKIEDEDSWWKANCPPN